MNKLRTRTFPSLGALVTALTVTSPASALDNTTIEQLATCQASWLDWKQSDPARLQRFVTDFRASFPNKGNRAFVTAPSGLTVTGLPVLQVFPESVGMGVGFSVMLNATFDAARVAVERKIGRRLGQCETGENMRTCGLEIAEKKTITLLSDENPQSTKALLGCFYVYEK